MYYKIAIFHNDFSKKTKQKNDNQNQRSGSLIRHAVLICMVLIESFNNIHEPVA